MKKDRTSKIEIQKPMKLIPIKLPEKISKKNPPLIAAKYPEFLWGFSKKFKKITEIKMRLGIMPEILK